MRVAAYARVSTQRQAQAQTAEQQLERLRALTCLLSAELALGRQDAVISASRQFEEACRDLDLDALAAAAGGDQS